MKTIQFKSPKYVGDPINAIKIFNEKEVDELIFLDITATLEKKGPNISKISEIVSECFMPLGYGGGIRNVKDIREIFSLGVEKAIINSFSLENPNFITDAANIFGSQSVVVSIDVKMNRSGEYEVFSYSGKKVADPNPVSYAITMAKLGAGEIFLNSVDNDGEMKGFDLKLIEAITKVVPVPVIVCGGAGKLNDIESAFNAGASAVAAGSMFVFYGKNRAVLINYPTREELNKVCNKNK